MLDRTRIDLGSSERELRRRLAPSQIVGAWFRRYPLRLFGATAAGVALLTSLVKPRRQEPKAPKPLRERVTGGFFSLCKSVVRHWFVNRAKDYLRSRSPLSETDSLLGP